MTTNPNNPGGDLLDIPAIHREYGLPIRTLEHLLYTRRAVPTVRLGRRLYVRRSDLLAYFAAQTVPARDGQQA